MHSHLIPGVDDGSPDLANSPKLIRDCHFRTGYTKLNVLTPHIMRDIYKNSAGKITGKLSACSERLFIRKVFLLRFRQGQNISWMIMWRNRFANNSTAPEDQRQYGVD
ncbi:MAG: hypothetical protein IPP99_12330 [Chitinophagaceae bacterium]|nr:hypothetical protein [Chitinophagaceae bacterium]